MDHWRDVPGYESFQVTSCGRVRAKAFVNESAKDRFGRIRKRSYKEKELRPVFVNPPGYLKVAVLRNKKRVKFYVHRLVALAFVDGYINGYQVNHKNGIKTDNRAENLEWVTCEENVKHAWETGLLNSIKGELNPRSKLVSGQVVAIRELHKLGISMELIARASNVSASAIYKIVNLKMWKDEIMA